MSAAIRLSSSLRECWPEVTLAKARPFGRQLGVTRVTAVTHLDWVGIPVYASIRPAASRGSLCVNAGKGLRPIEAEVGAWMEAIEFAVAEQPRADLRHRTLAAGALDDCYGSGTDLVSLCPSIGTSVPREAPIACVEFEDVRGGPPVPIPCELVYLPLPKTLSTTHCFGSSSNGLSSGNTLDEATLHGLLEVLERDVLSFERVRSRSALVRLNGLEGAPAVLAARIQAAGLRVYLRSVVNEYGLPWFGAWLVEPCPHAPVRIADGYGCHPIAEVAAVRALCEAAQSRLSFIHGGRDDIVERYTRFAGRPEEFEVEVMLDMERQVSDENGGVDWASVPDAAFAEAGTVGAMLEAAMAMLAERGFERVYRVELTAVRDPVRVVRVVVPGMEQFEYVQERVGRRLRDYVRVNL